MTLKKGEDSIPSILARSILQDDTAFSSAENERRLFRFE